MTRRDERSFDFLRGREADFMQSVIDELADAPWAKPLIDDINATGGLTGDNKAKLFELRFGHSLHKAGILPRYETAGEGQSTLDYGITVTVHSIARVCVLSASGSRCLNYQYWTAPLE